VSVTPERLKIVIRDNGLGFDTAPENGLADGLRNMRQRMTDIGGSLAIESRAGAGTEITLIFPFSNS
jgi:signal transduction histidine kinase